LCKIKAQTTPSTVVRALIEAIGKGDSVLGSFTSLFRSVPLVFQIGTPQGPAAENIGRFLPCF
jgi:hypothetical protein